MDHLWTPWRFHYLSSSRQEAIAKIQDFHHDPVLFEGYARNPRLLDAVEGFIGGIEASYAGGAHGQSHNKVVDWINSHRVEALVTVGICTDICVMDFVLTVLSARNHDMMPGLRDILVYEGGCATYDLPRPVAEELGFGAAASHPQMPTHHMGLYFMASRGAGLVDRVEV